MTAPSRTRVLVVAAAVLALAIGSLVWSGQREEPGPRVVGEASSREGWTTIAFRGVQVDVPDAWTRIDPDGCEFRAEGWAASGSDPCVVEEGLAFYTAATFDSAFGPGVRRRGGEASPWEGHAFAGEWAVYAASDDRAVVTHLLATVRAAPGS